MACHFELLFVSILAAALSASADVFLSIDCGATGSYTDENIIPWTGDELYNQNGEAKVVNSNKELPRAMSTLRVFSTRKKNCYSVNVDKGGQILARASFFYGNYDNKNSPPSFDLHYDGNLWANVITSSDQAFSYEAVYFPKGDVISICVARTKPNQLPFISALEIRTLDNGMYNHVGVEYALFLRRRVAFGADKSVRFMDDVYDRIWAASVIGTGLTKATSTSLLWDIEVEDKPPQSVFQNAITASSPSTHLLLGTNLPPVQVPIYITMYFAEVTDLDSTTDKRSFEIYMNDESISDPIVPPYGSVSEMYITNITASSSSNFSLVATTGSTLAPLINAMEVYVVSDKMTNGTHSSDIEGLASLQTSFDVLGDWGGDPCLPSTFTWDWLNCSADATPRVTALYLSGYSLSGAFPDISSMDSLQIIDLRKNKLDGPIPDFFGTMPSLKQLNLADNDFSGPIPSSLSKNTKLKLITSGNPNLCASGESCKTLETSATSSVTTSDPGTTGTAENTLGGRGGKRSKNKKKSSKLPAILGSTIPTFIVFWVIMGIITILRQKRKAAMVSAGPGSSNPNGTPQQGEGFVRKMGEAVANQFKDEIRDEATSAAADQVNAEAGGTNPNGTFGP